MKSIFARELFTRFVARFLTSFLARFLTRVFEPEYTIYSSTGTGNTVYSCIGSENTVDSPTGTEYGYTLTTKVFLGPAKNRFSLPTNDIAIHSGH